MLWCTLAAQYEGIKGLPETMNNQALWDFFQEIYQIYKETPMGSLAEAFCDYMESPIPTE